MTLAYICAGLLLLAACLEGAGKGRSLKRVEIERMKRYSDKVRREEALPFE